MEFFNQARFWYDLGQSDNFKIASIYLNQPYEEIGIGIVYSPEHWGVEWLYDVDVSAFIMEGGGYTIALDTTYDIADGYCIELHGLAGIADNLKRDYIDGRISVVHNLYPDSSMFIEAFYEDRADTGYFGFAVGGKV